MQDIYHALGWIPAAICFEEELLPTSLTFLMKSVSPKGSALFERHMLDTSLAVTKQDHGTQNIMSNKDVQ